MVSPVTQEYDLLAPANRRNPHPIYAEMRKNAPVYQLPYREMGETPWLLTRYDDCITLLKDDVHFSKSMERIPGFNPSMSDGNNSAAAINKHMLAMDPPDHTRLRNLVHKAFTPKMISEMGVRIQEIADNLIDQALADGHMDFIQGYAFPLPITVIAELLGIPVEDRLRFRGWTQTIVIDGVKGTNQDKVAVAGLEFMMYFHELFEKRRLDPKDDLVSGLLAVEEEGSKLDTQELLSMIFLLLVAGHETTVNLIGNGTLALLTHPDQKQMLVENPDLIKTAVEEMLRFEGPVGTSTMRWALEDVEFSGIKIPAGSMVTGSLLSANRDPQVFENPDVFDITRPASKHIAFGNGIHYCLGAPLARMEGSIAINTLLRRLPNLKLSVSPDELNWNDVLLLHGVTSMPVEW